MKNIKLKVELLETFQKIMTVEVLSNIPNLWSFKDELIQM